jgi:hypothetical protein
MSGAPPSSSTPPTTPQVPQPKPLYPDTPWWAALIAVIVTAFVSVIGTVVVVKGGLGAGEFTMPTGASILVDTVTYIPHVILLFGVLADMFTYDGVWSIPSLIGILSIFANFAFKYFWIGLDSMIGAGKRAVGATPAATAPAAPVGAKRRVGGKAGDFFSNYDGCNVQGFEGFGSRFAPQTLVVTATVFSYYIFDLVKNRGWMNAIAAIVAGSLLFIAEAFIIGTCPPPENGPVGEPIGAFGQMLRALAEGITFGGTSYAIVQTYYPQRLPSSVMSPFPKRSKDDLTPGPDGRLYDSDGYPWVVLPNGQTFPDMSTQRARNAFSQIASMQLGTGQPASQSCSS